MAFWLDWSNGVYQFFPSGLIGMAVFAVGFVYMYRKTKPLEGWLDGICIGDSLDEASIQDAARRIMSIPMVLLLASVAVALGLGCLCWCIKVFYKTYPYVQSIHFCSLVVVVLVFGLTAYLVFRRLFRPVLMLIHVQKVPFRWRFGFRARFLLWASLLSVVVIGLVVMGSRQIYGWNTSERGWHIVRERGFWDGLNALSEPQLMVVVCLIGLGAVLGWYLGVDIRIPTMALKAHLDRMVDSDDARGIDRLAVHPTSEVGAIAMGFNRLADRLDQEYAQLTGYLQQVRRTEAVRSRFLAHVSHELKTPLSSILGFSDILLQGVDGDISQKQRTYLEIINQEGERLLGLIDDILLSARLENKPGVLALSQYDACNWIREVIESLGDKAASRLRFESNCTERDMIVRADRYQLTRAVVGILENVMDVISNEGEIITVRMESDDQGGLHIKVACPNYPQHDTQDDELAFEGFRQIQRRPGAGYGVSFGLPLARKIARLHGGEVVLKRVENTAVFELRLPIFLEAGKESSVFGA